MTRILLCSLVALAMLLSVSAVQAGSTNGKAGDMPAYYDGQLFTINLMEKSDNSGGSIIDHNKSMNFIYESDTPLPGGQMFTAVLDAIQGDGFNPLWEEVQISFAAGVTPTQYTSDTDIEAAADAGQITLTPTGEVYRCSVVGGK